VQLPSLIWPAYCQSLVTCFFLDLSWWAVSLRVRDSLSSKPLFSPPFATYLRPEGESVIFTLWCFGITKSSESRGYARVDSCDQARDAPHGVSHEVTVLRYRRRRSEKPAQLFRGAVYRKVPWQVSSEARLKKKKGQWSQVSQKPPTEHATALAA